MAVVARDHRLTGEVDRIIETLDGRIADAKTVPSERREEHQPDGRV